MSEENFLKYKDNFFKHYANLPLPVRREVILDLEEKGGPITWEIAYREIEAETDLGKEILNKLVKFKFIPLDD